MSANVGNAYAAIRAEEKVTPRGMIDAARGLLGAMGKEVAYGNDLTAAQCMSYTISQAPSGSRTYMANDLSSG